MEWIALEHGAPRDPRAGPGRPRPDALGRQGRSPPAVGRVVEDDPELLGALERRLRSTGFAVDVATDLPEAAGQIAVNDYDCLVLDRSIPSGDSIDLLRDLRIGGSTTPALLLTARDAVADRVAGFEAGGDDYLVKPLVMSVVLAIMAFLIIAVDFQLRESDASQELLEQAQKAASVVRLDADGYLDTSTF